MVCLQGVCEESVLNQPKAGRRGLTNTDVKKVIAIQTGGNEGF